MSTKDQILAERVILRYAAARKMKPEKMQELFLKLRKGNPKVTVSMKDLLQVFAELEGWKLHIAPQWVEGRNSYSNPHANNVQKVWADYKEKEVSTLPAVSGERYQKAIMDVGPPGESSFSWTEWATQPFLTVTSPDHHTWTHELTGWSEQDLENEKLLSYKILPWLMTGTSFLKQINEKLGTDSVEVEREKNHSTPVNRDNTGTCPVCFRNIKVLPRTKRGKDKEMPGMVLHGYKRPGTGAVHGNCLGQDWPPFELSKEGTVAYAEVVETTIKNLMTYLQKLKDGKVTTLPDRQGHQVPVGDPRWERVLSIELSSVESELDSRKRDLNLLNKEISQWSPKPLV